MVAEEVTAIYGHMAWVGEGGPLVSQGLVIAMVTAGNRHMRAVDEYCGGQLHTHSILSCEYTLTTRVNTLHLMNYS